MQFLSDLVKCCTLSIKANNDPFMQESSTSPTRPKRWTNHTHKNDQKLGIQTCLGVGFLCCAFKSWQFSKNIKLHNFPLARKILLMISQVELSKKPYLMQTVRCVFLGILFFPSVIYNKKSGVFSMEILIPHFNCWFFKSCLQCIYWL